MSEFRFACPVCLTELKLGVTKSCCVRALNEVNQPLSSLGQPEVFYDSAYLFEISRYEVISRRGAGNYDGYLSSRPEYRAELLARQLRSENKPFVNVGSGFGWLEKSAKLPSVSLDFCVGFLEQTVKIAPNTKPVLAIAERLPFVSHTVDCLVSDCTFQSILDRERFLYEAWRVTAPGALLLFTVLTSWNYPRRPQNGFDVRSEDGRELLRRFLEELDFTVTEEWVTISEKDDYQIWACRKVND